MRKEEEVYEDDSCLSFAGAAFAPVLLLVLQKKKKKCGEEKTVDNAILFSNDTQGPDHLPAVQICEEIVERRYFIIAAAAAAAYVRVATIGMKRSMNLQNTDHSSLIRRSPCFVVCWCALGFTTLHHRSAGAAVNTVQHLCSPVNVQS